MSAVKCPVCGTEGPPARNCRECGNYLADVASHAAASGIPASTLPKKYAATRAVIGLLRFFGVAVLVLGLLGSLLLMDDGTSRGLGLAGVALSVLWSVALFAGAEGLQVLIDMEEHQRAIRGSLQALEARGS